MHTWQIDHGELNNRSDLAEFLDLDLFKTMKVAHFVTFAPALQKLQGQKHPRAAD